MSSPRISLFIGVFVLLMVACKKGLPESSNLRSLSGFSLDQESVTVSRKSNPQFSISGICDPQFSDVEISLDSGSNWVSASKLASQASINCTSTGRFSLTFAHDISSWILTGSAAESGLWKFRGSSDIGYSDTQSLNVLASQRGQLFLAGADLTTSGGYQLKSRIGGGLRVISTSGSYVLKGTAKVK
jgi:hypothetical protein